jgi:hypothetical protein
MSVKTRSEVMVKWRSRYRNAGLGHRAKIIDQAVEVFGYHRKSAIRALGAPARAALPRRGRHDVPRYPSSQSSNVAEYARRAPKVTVTRGRASGALVAPK